MARLACIKTALPRSHDVQHEVQTGAPPWGNRSIPQPYRPKVQQHYGCRKMLLNPPPFDSGRVLGCGLGSILKGPATPV